MPANIRPPLSVILAVLILVGCSGHPIAPTSGAISPTVSSYLSEMISIMEANAIFRDRIDWNGFREKVFQKAKEWGAQNITEAYPAIQTALGLLGDHHSFYQPSIGQTVFNPAPRPCSVSGAPPPSVPPDIGFVQISGFGGTSAEGIIFATAIQQRIRAADRPDLIGWIVDLRDNSGGLIWPMLAGVGPILGDGIAGYFFEPSNGSYLEWEYSTGVAGYSGAPLTQVSNPYQLIHGQPKVAVLTFTATASAGEAIVVAFRGRPNARSFGTPTCGVPTGNKGYKLSDGAILELTTAFYVDRTHTSYSDSIVPDQGASYTESVTRAIEWLRGTAP